MISEDKKQQILNKIDIVHEIEKAISLKKSGKSYRALCPFHQERTPSFFVDPGKQIFKCFGCGERGDVITFTMRHQNMSFIEAMEYLASEAGVALSPSSKREKKQRQIEINAYKVNENVKRLFRSALLEGNEDAERGWAYLRNRGLDDTTAESFHIGYAPPDRQWLVRKLGTQKATIDEAVNLGILRQDKTAVFCNRLIFPIHDKQGRVVGFAARTVGSEEPKYLNSSSSEVFQKSRHLYGLYENLQAISESDRVIIVEGYMDVLALYQAGVKNVVGLCGTALSEYHAKELAGLVKTCVLCLDGDEGGLRSVQLAITQLFAVGVFVKVAVLPEGEDPASLISQEGQEFFSNIIRQARSPIDFLCERLASESNDPDDPEWAEATATVLCEVVSHFPKDRRVVIDRYLNQIEKKLGISKVLLVPMVQQAEQDKAPLAVQPTGKKAKEGKSLDYTAEIEAIISPQNLLLAWRKVRHFAHTHDVYFDSKLFEQFEKRTDEYLFVLQQRLHKLIRQGESYMPEPFRHLRLEKPQGGVRDLALPGCIEDRIVIQAILNIVASSIEKTFSPNSFGHRLSKNFTHNEIIFEPWQNLYGQYRAKLRQFLLAPASYRFLKADISAFYDKVDRKRLCQSISNYVQNEWVILTVENFINYRLLTDDSTTTESELAGLPQGPAYGHFFANLYLNNFDRFVEKTLAVEPGNAEGDVRNLSKNKLLQLGYCRYVDDIFILFPSQEEAERCKTIFTQELERIALSFSEEKTKTHPVTDRQVIIDEMKSKKYTLGKLLDNDENLSVQQREVLYSAIEDEFLQIKSAADMAEVAKNIPFLVAKLTDTGYFKENEDDLINLIIELLFSQSFKHSSIGGVLKRTIPQIVESRWAKPFTRHLQASSTPDFKRILFLQSVEENNFYPGLGSELQACILGFLKSPTDFVRLAAVNCLWANDVVLEFKEVRNLVINEKNSQIQARLLHVVDRKCTDRMFPAFLERQAREARKALHALIVAQGALSDTSQKVINGCCLNGPGIGPVFVELLYTILRDGSREAVEQLEKLCSKSEVRQIVSELLKIILPRAYQLYKDGFIDTCSVLSLGKNSSYLKNERIKDMILQDMLKPLVTMINQEETDSALRKEFQELKRVHITENDISRYIIGAIPEGAKPVDVGFLNDRGVSYQAYRDPHSGNLDLFETIEQHYITETGNFKEVFDWLDYIGDARNDKLVWYKNTKIFKDKFGANNVLIHYHLDSSRVRICDLLNKKDKGHVGELELASFMKNTAEIVRQLSPQGQGVPVISPYNIVVDASLKPMFINLGTVFCKPRYISTKGATHRELSPLHDSLFLGWLSFEMLTGACPLAEIKNLPLTDEKKKYLTSSPKLATASIFYTRILRRLTYEFEDYRRPLRDSSNYQLLSSYLQDIQTLQDHESQGLPAEQILNRSLLAFWRHRISDAWDDPNLSGQGNAARIMQAYCRLMEDTINCQEIKDVQFVQSPDVEEPLQAGMHAGSAYLDGLLNQVEYIQSQQGENTPSGGTDYRVNLVIMYLTLRVELMAHAHVVRTKYFSNWAQGSIAKEFVNTSDKAKLLIKQLAVASQKELKARQWQSQMEFLSADIAVMLDGKARYECFTRTGLSGLYAFICLCTNDEERHPDMGNELKTVSDWERKVTLYLRHKKSLSKSDYEEIKRRCHNIINRLIEPSNQRIKAKLENNLMHWATKTAKVIFDKDGSKAEVNIDDLVCVTNKVYEKQRDKGEVVTCDLLDGKVVTLSPVGNYEKKLFGIAQGLQEEDKKTRREVALTQGDNSIAVTQANAPVNITINKQITNEKVYIHSPREGLDAQQLILPQEIIDHGEQPGTDSA